MRAMMHWLLKYEGYPPGIVFTVLLHGGLLLFIVSKELDTQQFVTVEKPVYITASTIKENPQRLRSMQQLQLQRQQEEQQAEARERERQQAAERQRQADAEKQRQAQAEQQRQADAERQRVADAERKKQEDAEKQRQAEAERQRVAEQERQRQAEAERQRVAAAEAERQRQQAAAAAAAQSEAASAQADLVQQYAALIHDLISQNWVIPPGARNGMKAVVEIRLTPIGDIVSAVVTQGSGNPAFDRSVEQAVSRVGSFPELRDLPPTVFERNFRVFQLIFSPEDLLR